MIQDSSANKWVEKLRPLLEALFTEGHEVSFELLLGSRDKIEPLRDAGHQAAHWQRPYVNEHLFELESQILEKWSLWQWQDSRRNQATPREVQERPSKQHSC